jgi:DNA-binding beta-propeller fold protein YncE
MNLNRVVLSCVVVFAALPCQSQVPPFRPFQPYGIVVDFARNRVVAANLRPPRSVEIFDRTTKSRRTVPLASPQRPDIDALTGRIYVPSTGESPTLAVIDADTGTIVSVVPLYAEYASAAIVDAARRRVFVLHETRVAIVDADSHAVDYVPLGVISYEAVLNPLDHRLYVAAPDMRALIAIDPVSRSTTTIPVSATPSPIGTTALTLNKATNQILMLTDRGKTLAIVDVPTYRVTTIPLPGVANRAMAVDAATGKAYIPNPPAHTLTIVDTSTQTVASVPVPAQPNRIAVNEATGKIYLGLLNPSGVVVMDRDSLAYFTITAGSKPGEVSLDVGRDLVYFGDLASVLVIDGKAATPVSAEAYGMAVEFHRPDLDHYVATTNPLEIEKLENHVLWARTGATFGTFLSSEGTTPMCRFYLPPKEGDSHLMMASNAECASTAAKFPNFVFESPDVLRVEVPDPTTGACPEGLLPVYRLWNRRPDSNHRYVVDTTTRDAMVAAGSVVEGFGPDRVGICVPRPATSTLP